jgi:hypothetical protein
MIDRMRKLGAPWLVSLPFMAAGCLAAHSLAYHLTSDSNARHGYLAFAPLAVGLLAAVAVVGTLRRGRPSSPLAFAALPPLAFVVQEHAERLELVATEPAFLVGLLLQLPFALAALVAARAFVGLADLVLETLATSRTIRRAIVSAASLPTVELPRPSPLAASHSSRAPPAVA